MFGGKEIVVQRNIKIPKIKGEKNADKGFQVLVAILEFIRAKKLTQEAASKALQQDMKDKGILIPVDFTQVSENAVSYAIGLAQKLKSK